MKNYSRQQLEKIFPKTCLKIGDKVLTAILTDFFGIIKPDSFPEIIEDSSDKYALETYIADLSLVELTYHNVKQLKTTVSHNLNKPEVNPTIELVYARSRVSTLFEDVSATVLNEEEWVLIWKDLSVNEVHLKAASPAEIYAIKIVLEDIPLAEAAKETNLPEKEIKELLVEQSKKGLIIYP